MILVRDRLRRYALRIVPAGTPQAAGFKPGDTPLGYWLPIRVRGEYTSRAAFRFVRENQRAHGYGAENKVIFADLSLANRFRQVPKWIKAKSR